MMGDVTVFRDADGAATFTCTTCGDVVCVIVPPDDVPRCLTCRFVEKHIPEEHREQIREILRRSGCKD